MESDISFPSRDLVKCCNCGCRSLVAGSSDAWMRSVKRKYQEFEDGNPLFLLGFDLSSNARILVENECIALREAASSQRQAIQDLYTELEKERNAASSAANEAMSMILRLQRDKAEIQMEARQFKLFAEEKMAHDQEELFAVDDFLYKREQAIEALTCELQAYKHRLMSYGLTEAEAEGEKIGFSRIPSMVDIDVQCDLSSFDYPPLKCNVNEIPVHLEGDVESPCELEHLKCLEHRISQLQRNSSHTQLDGDISGEKNVIEKVIVGQSPGRPVKPSTDSFDSSSPLGTAKEATPAFCIDSPRSNCSFKECVHIDKASEIINDMSDRVYTVDSIHKGVSQNGPDGAKKAGREFCDDYVNFPRYKEPLMNQHDVNDQDIKKLYMRLQALEADRESLRQTILSMQTDEAQLVLLKEIAQNLSKEMGPERRMPVRKTSFLGAFSFMSVCKWIVSLFLGKESLSKQVSSFRILDYRKFGYMLATIDDLIRTKYGKRQHVMISDIIWKFC